ncbi:hypothetical protein VST7929_01139 [Vibrio stylophorae]|uniref:Transporter n=1 Tax=Vibrio stylophorae TaxID=659351 RepID=A0ABN8DTZ3_9VIBR|nr:sodium-dependent transporter [Vibrio stylophorae]CAH0533275.1 hypothetical protein VST7929_01139 [Vibrio stylophorae]
MKREQWGSRVGFVLAAVGSAIGLGNIWRFPYMAYENGGGAFFLPYLIAMITAGIPFIIMEFALGKKLKGSAPRVFSSIHPKLEWLGWFQVCIAAVIAVYYVAIIGWAFSYFSFSFTQSWGDATKDFFFGEYLKLGGSPLELGQIQWHIVGAVALAWLVSFFAIFGGVKAGIERASKIMMPVLFVMVVVLIARVIFLDGAMTGLNYMFKPDFSRLSDWNIWSAAYGQIFFTLSIGFAIMLAYSSYLPEKSDVTNNAIMTVLINCGFSIMAGIMIFAVLGYMAQEQQVAVTEVVSSGVGLAFITIPKAINFLPIPYILGPLFFLALAIAGLSSHISILEAVNSAIIDKTGWSRKVTSAIVCGTGLVVSLAFTTNGGLFLLDVVDYFVNNIGILTSCLIELIIIGWFFNLKGLRDYINKTSEFKVGALFVNCIRYITSGALLVVVIMQYYTALTTNYEGYPTKALFFAGWCVVGAMIVVAVAINLFTKPAAPQMTAEGA